MATVVGALRPADVAREVERLVQLGVRELVLRPIAGGGMIDQERLGAARYAAGRDAHVTLQVIAEDSREHGRSLHLHGMA